jgi:hypothetical protein
VQKFLVTCDQFHTLKGHGFFIKTLFCFCFVTAEVKYFVIQFKPIKLSLIKYKLLLFERSLWSGCFCMRDVGFKLDEKFYPDHYTVCHNIWLLFLL